MATIRSDLESYVIAHDETQAHVLAPGAEVPDGVTIHPDLLEPEPENPEDPEDPEDLKDPEDPEDPEDLKDPEDPEDPEDLKDPEDSGDGGAGGEDKTPASPKTNRRSSRARKS